LEGIDILYHGVKSTLGPSGHTVIIANEGEEPYATKDGVTVAMEMNHKDPIMNVGIQMVRKVASKTDDDNGDGTTTATVICRSLIALGMDLRKQAFYDDHIFRKTIYSELDYILNQIDKNSREIPLSEIGKVAYTSANNDQEIANLFQKAFNNSGADGYINILETGSGKSHVDIIKGFVIEHGYADRKYANNSISGFFEAKKCKVVLYDNEFTDKREIIKLIERSSNTNPLPIVIFAKDFSKEVYSVVDFNNQDRIGNKICLIKNTLRNEEYNSLVQDIAHYTGAEPIQHFDEFDSELGEATDVIIKQGYSIFGEVTGTRKEILDDYLSLLEQAAAEEQSNHHSQSMQKRVDKMRNGITTFYVGGASDIEIAEKKHRVEDAYRACKAALKSKVVMGGGQTLVLLSKDFNTCDEYQTVFYRSIQRPFIEMLKNSFHSDDDIFHQTQTTLMPYLILLIKFHQMGHNHKVNL